jgi:hypothetical protein
MEKLTPFQKKAARWYDRLPKIVGDIIFFSFILSMILCIIFSIISVGFGKVRVGMLIVSCLLFLYTFAVPIMIINMAQWRWILPETYQKDAQELLENNPEFSDILNSLVQDSIVSDDGIRLAEKLEEVNKLISLKKQLISIRGNLRNLENKISETKTEITALEKELGM